MLLSWISRLAGTDKSRIGRPVPGGWMRPISGSGGKWCYLYRAITAGGHTLDFYLSPKRNVAAAKRFLAKTLRATVSAGFPG
ncbi:hypothetical protein CATRI_10585 [Corynebacterium atrinae]|nr:hypothetical protein CATRI_10585 [Corynebacterium atrinae]